MRTRIDRFTVPDGHEGIGIHTVEPSRIGATAQFAARRGNVPGDDRDSARYYL